MWEEFEIIENDMEDDSYFYQKWLGEYNPFTDDEEWKI